MREVEREIRAKKKDLEALEARLREEYEPQFKELVRYARRRKHTWLETKLLWMGDRSSDAERVDWLVELTTATQLLQFEMHMLGSLEIRKELREAKKRREAWDALK